MTGDGSHHTVYDVKQYSRQQSRARVREFGAKLDNDGQSFTLFLLTSQNTSKYVSECTTALFLKSAPPVQVRPWFCQTICGSQLSLLF